ncbi:MAG: RIP metalloprotease RseP [Bacilli bacterium]|nr:RIP metalloprotease RseP [Bacilli bacterium]
MTLIYFILILGIIVLVHEFGHFIFAKMFGVHVYEFSIGMGPKIWGKKRKNKKDETEYCIRAIPIGGFVSLAGEEIDDDKKVPKDKKMYNKPIWQRFLIMFFGAGNNFILAFLILFLCGIFFGSPNMDPVVGKLTEGYPMVESGIEEGDKFLKVNGNKISTIDDVRIYLSVVKPGDTITFEMKKESGKVVTYEVAPVKEVVDEVTTYRYGIEFINETEKGFFAPIKYAFEKTGALFKQMFITLKLLFTGQVGMDNLSGPVGIYSIVGQTRSAGIESVLQLVALLSINVGFINLLPFPAFDGGRILFLIIEKIKGSPVNPKVENIFHSIGFVLLLLLLLYITFNDIVRMFF